MSKDLLYTFYGYWGDPQNPNCYAPLIDASGNIIARYESPSLEETRQNVNKKIHAMRNVRMVTIENPYTDESFHQILRRGNPKSIAEFKALGILENNPPNEGGVWHAMSLSHDREDLPL